MLPYEFDLEEAGVCGGDTRAERIFKEFIVVSSHQGRVVIAYSIMLGDYWRASAPMQNTARGSCCLADPLRAQYMLYGITADPNREFGLCRSRVEFGTSVGQQLKSSRNAGQMQDTHINTRLKYEFSSIRTTQTTDLFVVYIGDLYNAIRQRMRLLCLEALRSRGGASVTSASQSWSHLAGGKLESQPRESPEISGVEQPHILQQPFAIHHEQQRHSARRSRAQFGFLSATSFSTTQNGGARSQFGRVLEVIEERLIRIID